MLIERIPHSGAWAVSADVGGRLVTRTYYGYSKREAVAMFRHETRPVKRCAMCASKISDSNPYNSRGDGCRWCDGYGDYEG